MNPHCNYCCVKNVSGKIVANQTVDFEQVQWLNFTIRAQDHGTPPRITELPVYLLIVDVNDNNPVFVQPSYQVLNRSLRNKCQPLKQICIVLLILKGPIL